MASPRCGLNMGFWYKPLLNSVVFAGFCMDFWYNTSMENPASYIGQTINSWTVTGVAEKRAYRAFVTCKCVCGNVGEVRLYALITGRSKSCGCVQRETFKTMGVTHGKTHSKEYRTWADMRGRVTRKTSARWEQYGARGITCCERWEKFENFYADMGDKPSPEHSLDRIDPNGNYEPSNCRWATDETQRNNLRRTRLVTYKGRTQSAKLWADEIGVNYQTFLTRLQSGKFTDAQAIETPIGKSPHKR